MANKIFYFDFGQKEIIKVTNCCCYSGCNIHRYVESLLHVTVLRRR